MVKSRKKWQKWVKGGRNVEKSGGEKGRKWQKLVRGDKKYVPGGKNGQKTAKSAENK